MLTVTLLYLVSVLYLPKCAELGQIQQHLRL